MIYLIIKVVHRSRGVGLARIVSAVACASTHYPEYSIHYESTPNCERDYNHDCNRTFGENIITMRQAQVFLVFLTVLCLIGGVAALSQGALAQEAAPNGEEREISFVIESEIGRALPRNILYDEVNERLAVVDAYGKLTLVDALTFETEHTLYEAGTYQSINDLLFSNDGRWFALAIDQRIELYDAATGQVVADLVDLSGALQVEGPLEFSRDDRFLKFEGVYPAPRSIRQFEGQTLNVPWIWNLPAARDEADSNFPREVEAWQFFDYRNGFVLGPQNRIVAALPGRLQVLDTETLDLLFEIETARYEQDPLTVWFSLRDDTIYARPVNSNTLVQVDTQDGVLIDIPLNLRLSQNDLELIGGVELGSQARLIGEPNTRRTNDLLTVLLGERYPERYEFHPLTVTLVDLVVPPADTGDNVLALLFVFDEQDEEGFFTLRSGVGVQQMVIGPENERLLLRRRDQNTDEEFIFVYDMDTGEQIDRFIPALRDIGFYDRSVKNRVLAYNTGGDSIMSDFQRFDAANYEVISEDLRYSRRFERFFFTEDSDGVVTLGGTEWRLWDVNTGEVLRREVLDLTGSIISTSSDGYRFLTRFNTRDGRTGVEVADLNDNSRRSVTFERIPGSSVEQIIARPDWERFFVIYSANSWGNYFPGNQVAMYDLDEGYLWHIAGDDLPPINSRQYGWVDDETVFVIGEGTGEEQPARIYGLEYDASGLPQCAVDAFPDQIDLWTDLWEQLVVRVRPDTLGYLTELICQNLPETAEGVQELLLPTNTPRPVTLTPIVIPDVPVCLTARYPSQVEEYAQLWREVTAGLPEAQIAQTERLLCEGIGNFNLFGRTFGESSQLTMLIDADTGERASGSFTRIERNFRPIQPIQDEFFRTEERALGQAVLAPNEELVAASNLPGELIIYRMIRPYQSLLDVITATANARLAEANLIGGLPSPTPTYNIIGTPRPTLTPTFTPTPIPPPDERVAQVQFGESVDLCPSETLFTVDNPPDGYSPIGQLIGPVSGDTLWAINPTSGRRAPEENVPQCGGIDCDFSPDRDWILATTTNLIYVVRPDNTDQRVLFSLDPEDEEEGLYPPPPFINWSGPRTLEYEVLVEVQDEFGRTQRVTALQRDILGVFPDPEPWIPRVEVNEIDATILDRQPGGPLVLVRTTYSTGVGPGYKYYLYNFENGDYTFFARIGDNSGELSWRWSPIGDRLFYYYPPPPNTDPIWYQFDFEADTHRLLGNFVGGTWSDDNRYVAYRTDRRSQPIAVYDTETGLTRTYCIPQLGARFYNGDFTWSPDSRYVAIQAFLPEDENVEGVGQHTMILDIESGQMLDLTTGVGNLVMWIQERGTYGEDQ